VRLSAARNGFAHTLLAEIGFSHALFVSSLLKRGAARRSASVPSLARQSHRTPYISDAVVVDGKILESSKLTVAKLSFPGHPSPSSLSDFAV